MGTKAGDPLKIFFFPLMSPGHMIPMLDIAKLFCRRGVSATIVTTPGNEPLLRTSIDRANSTYHHPLIHLLLLPFPPSVHHLLPSGSENLGSMSASDHVDFFIAIDALRGPLAELLGAHRPDCLVSDSIFPWTADAAFALGIPRLVFHGHGAFPLCVHRSLQLHNPHAGVSSDSEPFAVEGLPDHIQMTRSEISPIFCQPDFLRIIAEAEEKSFGVVVNTFYKLEPAYAELYRKPPGPRAWFVGPVSLSDKDDADRGGRLHPDHHRWLSWLNSKAENSVVYVCFGSLCELSGKQLREIALGLAASGQPFFWVVREKGDVAGEDWLPEGLEERGMVVIGWAPQVVVLNHPAVGGFVTHCGWNSTLEGVAAGVPMVTWPLWYEQFVNEKLLTEVVGIGVRVRRGGGGRSWVVTREEVAAAVAAVMGGGEEAEGRRRRAMEYAVAARAAVEEGGSSYQDIGRLLAELAAARAARGGEKGP
ncbi:Scopoletin glucosyltransferase [Cocos nucifera]|uniref:Glycosyltransferase n=1 Tax=Cocos nucifera TaxID=13894 RepID=A0A8K0I8D4_COCNU|nr:Scopoletin glucosyltransferase [Cocos nucifera]